MIQLLPLRDLQSHLIDFKKIVSKFVQKKYIYPNVEFVENDSKWEGWRFEVLLLAGHRVSMI